LKPSYDGARRFLFLSESRVSNEVPDYALEPKSSYSSSLRDPQENPEVTSWPFFFVMLIEVDEMGADERRGIGQIYQRALDYSCAPGMRWEEVILG